jgi:hypothetical protein
LVVQGLVGLVAVLEQQHPQAAGWYHTPQHGLVCRSADQLQQQQASEGMLYLLHPLADA